jgi:hypothetical protein
MSIPSARLPIVVTSRGTGGQCRGYPLEGGRVTLFSSRRLLKVLVGGMIQGKEYPPGRGQAVVSGLPKRGRLPHLGLTP